MARGPSFRHPRFRIVRLLAEGGMGKVYLAHDLLEGNREVALKVYPASFHHERLRSEFLALRELHHPGIARALHFGISVAGGAPFFTLEYVRGEPIEQYLDPRGASRDRRAPEDPGRGAAALQLLGAVTAAVAYLHRKGILHLDLKPENILVPRPLPGIAPQPVLIDFGLVRTLQAPGALIGHATLPYAPPEAFTGKPPSPASDVYSLGATFYRLFSGRFPVEGTSFESLRRAHRSSAVPPLHEAPPAVARMLLRALAKDPARRFRDAGELQRVLSTPEVLSLVKSGGARTEVLFHEPDFVGRRRELKAVEEWLDSDRREKPVFVVSSGEGWGKTRFLEKVQTLIETRGRRTLLLRGSGAEGWPLHSAASHGIDVLSAESSAPGKIRSRRRAPSASPGAPGGEEEARLTARRLAARTVSLLGEETFLLIDDLHLAHPLEQRFVEEAARSIRGGARPPSGGIIVTTRKGGQEAGASWRDEGLAAGCELGPLSSEEALQIDLEGLDGALARHSAEKARALKEKVYRTSGGHPLFYVRGLFDLAGDPREATRLAPTERIVAHVRRLAGSERRTAQCLACVGRPAEAGEVAEILSLPARDVDADLQRLRQLGLVVTSGSTARVIHESVAGALLGGISRSERADMHRRIAACLERRREGWLLQAAGHYFEAGEDARAIDAAEQWVASGIRSASAAGAETLRRAAVNAGVETPGGLRLLEAMGDVLEGLGRFEECIQARSQLTTALEGLSRATPGEDEVRSRRKLGGACQRAGRVDLALEHLTRCVEPRAATAAPLESLRARADLALLYHFRGETEKALKNALLGVGEWRRSPPRRRHATIQSAVNFHSVLGQIYIRRLELAPALKVLEDGVRLAERIHSPTNTALLLNNLALANHLAGHLDAALTTFRRAEAIAEELEDPAALVSVRSNVAQVLARKGRFAEARTLIDELEESPAVAQSRRFRFWCLYTRGLIASLLGSGGEDVWPAVETLGAEVGDEFLVKFARIYRAEADMARGLYSSARWLLGAQSEAILTAPRLARLSLVESLCGHHELARQLRIESQGPGPDTPRMLRAWNLLYLGASAAETGDWSEAESLLGEARKLFREVCLPPGEIECALLLADLRLRAAAGARDRRALSLVRESERDLAAARQVPVEAPRDASPRSRDLRGTILEARVLLWKLSHGHANDDRRPGAETAAAADAAAAALRDLLARAAGDPGLASDPDSRLAAECITAAAARLAGDVEAELAAAERVKRLMNELAARLDEPDRGAYLERDPWRRFGLEDHRPPEGEARLQERHAAAIAVVLRELAGSRPPDSLSRVLEEVARATGARVAEVIVRGKVVARYEDVSAALENGDGSRMTMAAPCRHRAAEDQGGPTGRLCIEGEAGHRFSAADGLFLAAAARAVAPHLELGRGAAPEAIPGDPSRTALLSGRRGPGGHASGKTIALHRTSRLTARETRTGALADLLREEGIVAAGKEMLRIVRAALALASSEIPVLISGESGTGKNLIARLLHRLSPRAGGPFLAQMAGALPAELFEADLFGYERGAFTGAESSRTGFLFQATGGTLHLEEIGDLELGLQQRLLRVIEEKVVRPLGATSSRRLDVRFLASTQRDIDAMVRKGEFRKDLFYRLNGARLHLPPLRQRLDEMPELVSHHWRQLTGSAGRFSPAAIDALRGHDWPGNVRELASVLRRLSMQAQGAPGAGDIRAALGERGASRLFSPVIFESRSFEETARALEESYLEHLLEKHEGDLDAIAASLGTTSRSVYRRFERLGLKPGDFKGKRG